MSGVHLCKSCGICRETLHQEKACMLSCDIKRKDGISDTYFSQDFLYHTVNSSAKQE